MSGRKKLHSEMGWSTVDRIVVRGHDLPNELIGHIGLGDMAFLEIVGRRPNEKESELFNAVLVTLVEHGMTPQAMATRLINMAAPEAIQGAVAGGLLGVGSVFAGGSEQTAKILQEALRDRTADSPGIEKLAAGIVEAHVARKEVIPGIGHPMHKPVDPRTPVLFGIAQRTGFRGDHVALLEAISREAERRLQRTLPINATGAIGALLCELGFPWRICRGVVVISRAVGLVGHLAEEMRNPLAREIWERAEAEVYENKD
jgi:citrate synthase